MKKAILIAACSAATACFAQPRIEPPVAVRLNNLPTHVRERVQAHADKGVTSLARYLELTRTVYQLRLTDVLAGYDRSAFVVDGAPMTDRQVEEAVREGKVRPVR